MSYRDDLARLESDVRAHFDALQHGKPVMKATLSVADRLRTAASEIRGTVAKGPHKNEHVKPTKPVITRHLGDGWVYEFVAGSGKGDERG